MHLNYYTPAINSPEVGEYVNPLMVGVTVTVVGSRVGLLLGRGDGSRVGFVLGDIVGASEGTSEIGWYVNPSIVGDNVVGASEGRNEG